MAKFNIDDNENTLLVGMKQAVFTKYGFDISEEIARGYIKSLFTAISEFLKIVKSESEPVSLEVTAINGEFIFAATVRYEKNDDPTMPGNWVYSYTFNAEDVADVKVRYQFSDPQFCIILSNTMYEKYNFCWNVDTSSGNKLTIGAFEAIKTFLETNANESELTELECGDLFVATSGVEDGEKVISITPGEKSKQIIKEPTTDK